MIYPSDIEIRLGFDKVKALAQRYCNTVSGREKLQNTTFSSNRKRIVADLSLVSEMKSVIMLESSFPDCKWVDINSFVKRALVEGVHLSVQELGQLRDALRTVNNIVVFFENKEKNKYPFLKLLVSRVDTFPEIIDSIDKIVDSHSNIKDNASLALLDICRELSSKEKEATKRLHSILKSAKDAGIVEEDASISIRDGRAVIPVLSSNKRKIKGFVHDESATGKTSYIEPDEVVEINNEIRELQYAQKREIIKILTIFTESIRPDIPSIVLTGEFIATFDFITAKAKLAIDFNAHKPIISRETEIKLISARHPLLERALKKDNKPIVPLNLTLTKDKHILVISGPNAGGKSVCLKSVGLLQFMLQCGYLIPASANSELGIFQELFIDIGDQQSIDNDLSTYSSHLENMKKILRYSNENSLVLIDEFGSGTEPAVGGAIAEVILENIEKKGAFGVITTHYTNIKFFASNSKGIINGAMTFDVQNIKPLFNLEIGIPGSSFAFEIAHKIGLPSDIIKEAKNRVGDSQVNIERQLREIARDKVYWERKREVIKNNEKNYIQITEDYTNQLAELKEKRALIIKNAKLEAESIIKASNKIIENTIREIRESAAEKERTKEIRTSLKEFEQSIISYQSEDEIVKIERKIEKIKEREKNKKIKPVSVNQPQDVEIKTLKKIDKGDKVRIKGQSVIGIVTAIEKNRAIIAFGSVSTTTEISKLELCSNVDYKKQSKDANRNYYDGKVATTENYDVSDKRLNFKSDIDIRGSRVEEAIPIVERLIDEAAMLGVKELRVLHGKGTGALKEEIRKYLRIIPNVVSARDENIDHGGSGITIITIE